MLLNGRLLLLASLFAGAAVSLMSNAAEACDWQPGIVDTFPRSETTIAANDRLVLSILESDVSLYDVQVQVDGVDAPFELTPLFEERSVFLDSDLVAVTLSEPLTEGATLSLTATSELVPEVQASYEVGAADESELRASGPPSPR